MKRTVIFAFLLILAVATAVAVTTNKLEVASLGDFIEGESQWVEISALGKIRPGPALRKHKLGEQQVWDLLAHSSGKYFIATGLRGRIMMLERGKVRTAYETAGALVSSLVEGPGGKVYAGVAPGGEVYVLNSNGTGGKVFCKLDDKYVWALAMGKDGTLYAGTGPMGKVFAIDKNGKAEKILSLKNDQVVRLAIDSQGVLYAGTAKKGALYAINTRGGFSSSIITSFSNKEISGLALGPDGSIVLGLNSLKIRAQKPSLIKRRQPKSEEGQGEGQEQGAEQAGGPGTPQEAVARAKCEVVKITKEGFAQTLFSQDKMYITDIAVLDDGKIVFATGPDGRVLSISADSEINLTNDLPESQASVISTSGGKLAAVATANPGVLYLVEKGKSGDAQFTSAVMDASLPSEWGRVSWIAEGSGLAVETRSGKIERPDDSWSEWRSVRGNNGVVASPPARYIQVRINWKDNKTALRSLSVFYRPINMPTTIYKVDIDGEKSKKSKRTSGASPKGAEIQIKWKVINPDGDETAYKIEYRSEGQRVWVPITLDFIDKTSFKWDSSEMPDGWYRIRITSSDEISNPEGMEKTDRWISEPILIDNNKPVIKNLRVRGNEVTGIATDGFSVITDIAYSIDGAEWVTVWPEDGFLDQTSESFKFVVKGLDPGEHEIAVIAKDEGGNFGVEAAVFSIR